MLRGRRRDRSRPARPAPARRAPSSSGWRLAPDRATSGKATHSTPIARAAASGALRAGRAARWRACAAAARRRCAASSTGLYRTQFTDLCYGLPPSAPRGARAAIRRLQIETEIVARSKAGCASANRRALRSRAATASRTSTGARRQPCAAARAASLLCARHCAPRRGGRRSHRRSGVRTCDYRFPPELSPTP